MKNRSEKSFEYVKTSLKLIHFFSSYMSGLIQSQNTKELAGVNVRVYGRLFYTLDHINIKKVERIMMKSMLPKE